MEPLHGPWVIRPTDKEFYSISKLMMTYAENALKEEQANEQGLIVPKLRSVDDARNVQKDGPGGKKGAAMPPVMSLRTVDGQLYVLDHGQMIQKGYFQYRHIAPSMMESALRLKESVSLVPIHKPEDNPDGTDLIKKEGRIQTPTSETVNLLGVKYGKTLALEYSDDPKDLHAQLVLIPQKELKQVMEDITKGKKRAFKTNPLIKIRTYRPTANSDSYSGGAIQYPNNVALYFITSYFYYYIYVTHEDPSSPKVFLKPVDKKYDPHIDFINHLQFTEQFINIKGEDTPDGQLATVREEDLKQDPLPDIDSLTLNGCSLNDSTECPDKPTSLEIVSDSNELINGEHAKKEILSNDLTPVQGKDSKSLSVIA